MRDVTKAVIKNGDKFLIVLRSNTSKTLPGKWDLPGGKIDPGETLEECVVREVKEETNLDIKPIKILGKYEFDLKDAGYLTHRFNMFDVEVLSEDIKLSDDHQKFRWATKDEILKLDIMPFFIPFFKDNPEA